MRRCWRPGDEGVLLGEEDLSVRSGDGVPLCMSSRYSAPRSLPNEGISAVWFLEVWEEAADEDALDVLLYWRCQSIRDTWFPSWFFLSILSLRIFVASSLWRIYHHSSVLSNRLLGCCCLRYLASGS